MASVDNRIVRMEFDNAAFERKLGTTLTSLGKLEKALKFDKIKEGFAGIGNMVDKFHFGDLGENLENVGRKFLSLGSIANIVLAGITTKAISAGTQLAKSLSLDQVISGFKEYETNMQSIQTIMANTASKGTTLEQVNAALDQLNKYSDQTIYNFGEMAKNIGTFTAAGVDLNTSVASIKGIANIAAMSGSSSEQASSAMYQLSQAIATGSLKLMDWNSVVNAGMGGEAFKSALFETGKAMGTLTDVPMSQSFKQWEDSGNSFRDSLQDEWITAEVLTTTLEGFTGDLTEAMLIERGFTQQQASSIVKTAAMAKAAATEVKTFTQLVGTVKEAIGTGWADSFKIVIGNFTEAKELWTSVNTSIGTFVSKSAEARNALLQGWKDLGGRTLLIESLKTAFQNLGAVLKPIQEAFRAIFPAMTAQRLFDLTKRFADFAAALKPSETMIKNISRIFKGLFAILEIGWTIIKEGVKFIWRLVDSLIGLGGGKITEFLGDIFDFFTDLNSVLVDSGGIVSFFEKLPDVFKAPIPFIKDLKDNIFGLFDGFDPNVSEAVTANVERFRDRLETLRPVIDRFKSIGNTLQKAFLKVAEVLDNVWDAVSEFFSNLGSKIAELLGKADYDQVKDAINVGLLAVIAGALVKFIKGGFKFDIGSGFLEKIGQSFEQLTGVLTAMQQNIKADALLKIAGAIALLTASVLVLSLIDSEALTKALIAMSVGFGQLMASFAILSKISAGPKSAASLILLSVGMTAMAGAILLLSLAAKSLSELDWNELAKGLLGVTALMGIMIATVLLLEGHEASLISIGIGMIGIAVAINILAGAVKIFATMSWEELGKGFAAVAVGLGIIALAMKLMPPWMPLIGAGLILVAAALSILAGVIAIFGTMEIETMAKGFAAIAVGLIAIGIATKLMPPWLPLIGYGLVLVGKALLLIAGAMFIFGKMDWDEIGRGLAAMGGALLILAGALYLMSGAIGGAIALGIASAALLVLLAVIKGFASIKWDDLLRGLAGVAAVLGLLAIAALLLQPAIPALLLLGIALTIIGLGFALFGVGAMLVAKAFELLAKAGAKGSEALIVALKNIGKALPSLVQGFAEGIAELIKLFIEMIPLIVEALIKLLGMLLDGLITLIPKLGKVISTLITTVLALIRTKYPEFVATGISLIISLLTGIRNAIPRIVTIVTDIIVAFINGISQHINRIVDAGVNLLVSFLEGITESVEEIATAASDLITTFIEELAALYIDIISAGLDALLAFLQGITDNLFKIADAATDVIVEFCEQIGASAWRIANAAATMVIRLANALGANAWRIIAAGTNLIIKLVTGLGNAANRIVTAASNAITSFITGLGNNANRIVTAGTNTIISFIEGLGRNAVRLANAALTVVINFLSGMRKAIDTKAPQIRDAAWLLAGAIINGITGGLAEKARAVIDSLVGIAEDAVGAVTDFLHITSPSKVFIDIGEKMAQGLVVAFDHDTSVAASAVGLVDRTTDVFKDSMSKITDSLGSVEEFNPAITPVLDLTQIAKDAQLISGYIQTSEKLVPSFSYAQARTIADTTNAQQEDVDGATPTGEIKFEQNIYAPEQLSTSDIYKQTRNQITMAKEELAIP